MNIVGKSEVRVDAFDKATGRTKYYDDLAPKDALLVSLSMVVMCWHFYDNGSSAW